MRYLSITIVLRILLIISFALIALIQVKNGQLSDMFLNKEISYEYYVEKSINSGWFSLFFLIIALINTHYTYYHSKKRNNGRILMKEIVIPEMHLVNDERETEITGKSAKVALSVIVVATFFTLPLFPLVIQNLDNPISYSIITIAALPIIGLLSYFITYKILYSR